MAWKTCLVCVPKILTDWRNGREGLLCDCAQLGRYSPHSPLLSLWWEHVPCHNKKCLFPLKQRKRHEWRGKCRQEEGLQRASSTHERCRRGKMCLSSFLYFPACSQELPLWCKDFWIYEVNCVQLIEFIIQHQNTEKNCLLCPLMSAIKTSGESNFMNDPLWLTW